MGERHQMDDSESRRASFIAPCWLRQYTEQNERKRIRPRAVQIWLVDSKQTECFFIDNIFNWSLKGAVHCLVVDVLKITKCPVEAGKRPKRCSCFSERFRRDYKIIRSQLTKLRIWWFQNHERLPASMSLEMYCRLSSYPLILWVAEWRWL
jgi:hypothetical protein